MKSQYQLNKFNKTFTHPVSVVTTYTLEKIIKIHHTQSNLFHNYLSNYFTNHKKISCYFNAFHA